MWGSRASQLHMYSCRGSRASQLCTQGEDPGLHNYVLKARIQGFTTMHSKWGFSVLASQLSTQGEDPVYWLQDYVLKVIQCIGFTTMYLRRLCTQGDCVLKVAICVLKVTVYSMWLCTQGDYVLKVTMYSSLQVTMHSRWLYTQCDYVLKVTVHSRWLCTDGGFVLKVTMNSRWLCTPGDCILKWLCTIGEHPVDFLLTWQSYKIVLCLLLSFIKRQVTVTVQSTVHNCIVRSFTFLLKKSLSFLRSVV